ncbi:MAG TPA: energy transducer TonB [Tahibacter sp.]|uniref:energy transducer TonB n=1 Tax=Tahibacter sp. TaxID=2056211 RepID=UPI002C12BA6A|nr:energy transducer TonB [Tahibacter sp.]HSX60539.1 energy transducer TonB [Tahibacter sp.]
MAARIDFRSLRHARGNAAPKIIAAIVVVAALGAAGWYFFLRTPGVSIPEAVTQATEAGQAAPGSTTAPVTPDPATLDKLNTLTVDQLFKEARTALNEQRLVSPPGNNALEFYLKILEKEPGNSGAQDALRELFTFAASAAEQDINARNIDNANRVIELLTKVDPNNYTLTILRSKLDAQRKIAEREAAQAAAAEEAARRRAAEPAATAATPASTPGAGTTGTAEGAGAAPSTASTGAGTRTATPAATPEATPAATTASAAPAAAAPAGGETRDAVLVKSVPPQYPNAALRRRQEGWVQVEFTVTSSGSVANARVLDADPPRTFDRAALDAVQRWNFNPAMRNGAAVEATVRRRIEFKM